MSSLSSTVRAWQCLAREGKKESLTPGQTSRGTTLLFSQASAQWEPQNDIWLRSAQAGRWDDVYGLAVSEDVPPSEDVSDRSCTTQFMFDPEAPCMGTLDICKRGCNCFPPEVGTAPRGRQGSAFERPHRVVYKDRGPCLLELIRPGEGERK